MTLLQIPPFAYWNLFQSCERIRTALDQLEPEKDVENFVNEYGTGNMISQPAIFNSSNEVGEPELPGSPILRYTQYQRISRRPPMPTYINEATIVNNHPDYRVETTSVDNNGYLNGDGRSRPSGEPSGTNYVPVRSAVSPPQTSPPSHPPPPVPEAVHVAPVAPAASTSAATSTPTRSTHAPPASTSRRNTKRASQPLPVTPQGGDASRAPARVPTPPPPLPQQPNRILFYGECFDYYVPFREQGFSAICKRIERSNTNFFFLGCTVKALYDYQATIPEEFDFQAGDIIAVTDTPDDGWWSGELLDEARRVEGRNVFPSNFVCLF